MPHSTWAQRRNRKETCRSLGIEVPCEGWVLGISFFFSFHAGRQTRNRSCRSVDVERPNFRGGIPGLKSWHAWRLIVEADKKLGPITSMWPFWPPICWRNYSIFGSMDHSTSQLVKNGKLPNSWRCFCLFSPTNKPLVLGFGVRPFWGGSISTSSGGFWFCVVSTRILPPLSWNAANALWIWRWIVWIASACTLGEKHTSQGTKIRFDRVPRMVKICRKTYMQDPYEW